MSANKLHHPHLFEDIEPLFKSIYMESSKQVQLIIGEILNGRRFDSVFHEDSECQRLGDTLILIHLVKNLSSYPVHST